MSVPAAVQRCSLWRSLLGALYLANQRTTSCENNQLALFKRWMYKPAERP